MVRIDARTHLARTAMGRGIRVEGLESGKQSVGLACLAERPPHCACGGQGRKSVNLSASVVRASPGSSLSTVTHSPLGPQASAIHSSPRCEGARPVEEHRRPWSRQPAGRAAAALFQASLPVVVMLADVRHRGRLATLTPTACGGER